MNNKYAETFQTRGHPYDLAMQRYPESRHQEFERLFDRLDMATVHNVLDLPSGGGYLRHDLPEHCRLHSADPSQPFQTSNAIKTINLEALDLPESSYDLVISLAALHHIDNKSGFLSSVSKSLTSGGYLCFADVAEGSGISHFLDDFSGLYNGTGHQGDYLNIDQPFPGFKDTPSLTLIEHAIKPCHWVFSNEQNMVDFCRLLFGLKDVSDKEIHSALEKHVGIEKKNHYIELKWELLYITMQRDKC